FFFSSRRRHTRCYRDWSSDVCSSDLAAATDSTRARRERSHLSKVGELAERSESERRTENTNDRAGRASGQWIVERPFKIRPRCRSEERRVGKEWRTRWGQCQEKKTVS